MLVKFFGCYHKKKDHWERKRESEIKERKRERENEREKIRRSKESERDMVEERKWESETMMKRKTCTAILKYSPKLYIYKIKKQFACNE